MNRPKWLKQAAVGATAAVIMASLTSYMEGIRLTPYGDVGGVPTVCEGLTQVPMRSYTKEQCAVLDSLQRKKELLFVESTVSVKLTQPQKAAFADFVYNVGHQAWLTSTARKLVNSGNVKEGCKQLLRWVWAAGKRQPGLVKRRTAEYQLCMGEF